MTDGISDIDRKAQEQSRRLEPFYDQVGRVIVGQKSLIDRLVVALITGGHVLLEGVPGLAKTLLVRTAARAMSLSFARIQFTPDLLPADVVGTQVYHPRTGDFAVKHGPIFANVVLADEINRAPAKVQSALLEAMQELQVTLGDTTHPLPQPFFVLATQNPIEQEGTYPLPERNAKLKARDIRFAFKVHPLSIASMGSGTITVPIFTSGEMRAKRIGSPLSGLKTKSIGSSGFLGSPHCSSVLPAHMRIPSLPTEMPSNRVVGLSALTAQSMYLNSTFGGTPVTKMWYFTTTPAPELSVRETTFAWMEVPGGTICSKPTSMSIRCCTRCPRSA
jgi:hypothetical protein